MTKRLTAKQERKWIRKQDGCPVCGSRNVGAYNEDSELHNHRWEMYKEVHCSDCGANYEEKYVAIGIKLIRGDDEPCGGCI